MILSNFISLMPEGGRRCKTIHATQKLQKNHSATEM